MYSIRNTVVLLLLLIPTGAFAVTAGVDDAKSIARLYSAAFDRNPDIGGLNFWVYSYEAGRSLVSIAGDFHKSPEFTSRYGSLTDQQFVERLYQNILGRDGEREGVNFWTDHLSNGVSRARILAEFADSPENVARTAKRFADMREENCQWIFGPAQNSGGKTGYLVGPTATCVAYESASHKGMTGKEGDFQYEEGETVRFMIGDTLLGEVMGQEQVTPFDLAGAPVMTGIELTQKQAPTDGVLTLYPDESFKWVDTDDYPAIDTFDRPDPFDAVVNIAVLLQSLDEDDEPGNGIVIPRPVTNLFRGVSLDLRQEWGEFQGYYRESTDVSVKFPTLRYLHKQANQKQLFAVAHSIAKPAVALRHVYETLGIDSRIYSLCPKFPLLTRGFGASDPQCEYDENGNLTWLQLDPSGFVFNYEYDANGNMTLAEENTRVKSWEYDAKGNLVRAVQGDGSGTPESVETWQYDNNGNMVRYEEGAVNGAPSQFETCQYDKLNRPRQCEYRNPDRGDDWGRKIWQYGANGKLGRYEDSYFIESNGDASTRIWEYNADGKLARYDQENSPGDGRHFTTVVTRQYDAQGNFTQEYYFGENQLTLQMRAQYQFDANGNPVRIVRDYNNDDNPEKKESWQYDENGNMVRYECEDEFDGCRPGDFKSEYSGSNLVETWQYNANGRPVRVAGRDAGGGISYTRVWVYSANGNLKRYEKDEDGDGLPDSIETWQYNASGKLTLHKTDNGDGRVLFERWIFGSDDTLTRFERNHDGDDQGVFQSWQYHASGWGSIFWRLPGLPGLY